MSVSYSITLVDGCGTQLPQRPTLRLPSGVHHGCSYEDRQKIGASHHREVLLSPHDGLPHQQACVRRGSHHPLQAYAQQDCWVRDALDEANPEGPCARNFAQAAGGGAGEAHGLRAGGVRHRARIDRHRP